MSTEKSRFKDKVAIVTGSAKGMGKQLAVNMAAEGARVVLTDIDEGALNLAREEIERDGGECIAIPCDVSKPEAIEALVAEVTKEWRTVDILVNNAGLLLVGTLEEMDDDIIDRTLDVNVKGVLYFIRAVAPIMKKNNYGKIINVASITGKNGDGSTFPVYGGSKGAVISITRSIARALGPFNVNCNAIAPHAVMTEMMSYWTEERKERARSKIPLNRLGTVEDMSNLMLFLASEESSFITGETININGGYYMD